MAVFPLGTVLLPGQILTLQVFEPRYRVMLFDLRDDRPAEFVVVLIERGSEVGGGEVRSSVGTVARIVGSDELDDGRHLLVSVGTRRVSVRRWLEDDPYPRALVDDLADDEPRSPHDSAAAPAGAGGDSVVDRDAVTARARSVAALACELGAPAWPDDLELAEESTRRLWQLALLSPLATFDRQRLLCTGRDDARWRLLATMLDEQAELLEARLGFGGAEG